MFSAMLVADTLGLEHGEAKGQDENPGRSSFSNRKPAMPTLDKIVELIRGAKIAEDKSLAAVVKPLLDDGVRFGGTCWPRGLSTLLFK